MKIRKIAVTFLIALTAVVMMNGTAFAAANTGASGKSAACATCHGTGKTTCTWCKGTGQMSAAGTSYTCITCKGTGLMKCLGCLGTGQKREKVQNNAGTGTKAKAQTGSIAGANPGTVVTIVDPSLIMTQSHMQCSICHGAGKRVCQSCRGNGFTESQKYGPNFGYGSSMYWTKSSCAACRGTGQVICTSCGGDGQL